MTSAWERGCRPVTLREMGMAFDIPFGDIKALVQEHGIAPTLTIEGLQLFGGRQVRRVYALAVDLDLRHERETVGSIGAS